MAVQDIIKALSGTFIPTGSYSFEFRKKGGKTIAQVFFMLPPESVRVRESERSEIEPTLTGGYITDYGNEFKDISVTGSCHFFYAGTSRQPSRQFGVSTKSYVDVSLKKSASSFFYDGYTEFFKLRYILMRYRDYTLTSNATIQQHNFSEFPDLAGVESIQKEVKKMIESGAGALRDKIDVVWHDYDMAAHYKVKINSFVWNMDSKDPFTVKYSIDMTGYAVDTRTKSNVKFRSVYLTKKSPDQDIKQWFDYLGGLMPATLADEILLQLPSGKVTNNSLIVLPQNFQQNTTPPLEASIDISDINLAAGTNILTQNRRLPGEIKKNPNLFNLNTKLTNARSLFTTAVTNIVAGTTSVKRALSDITFRTFNIIEEMRKSLEILAIPKESSDDFLNGLITLDQFASFEISFYYSELNSLKLGYKSIESVLLLMEDFVEESLLPISPSGNNQGVVSVLKEEDFLEQGFDNPVIDRLPRFTYYTVISGDTLQSIARKVYEGDFTRWTEIGVINGLSDSDLLDSDLSGLTIKIPVEGTSRLLQNNNNLVFEKSFNGSSQEDIDNFLYGTDLKLFEGRMLVDSSGDLRTMKGVETVIRNIEDRFKTVTGGLNPIHSEYGIEKPESSGLQAPFVIFLDRVITDMENQASDDPRVNSARVLFNTLKTVADQLFVTIEISLIGGATNKSPFLIPV